ncbi:unnamed protein product, partial [Symbiodinium pilosum]
MGCRPKQEPKPGTDASVRSRQSRALRRRGDSATNPAGPTVLPGLDHSQVAAATSPSSGPNLENSRGLLNFAQRTALIKRNNQAIIDNRRQNAKAFPQAQLRKAIVISRRGDDANFNSNMARYLAGIRRWKVVDACQDRIETEFATPSEASPELRSRRLDGGDFLTFTAQSHLVVVDSLDALGSKRPFSGFNACHGGGSTCWRAVWLPVVSREMWTEHLAGQPLNKFMCHARSIDTDIVLAIEQQEDGQDRHFQQFAQSLVALSRGSWRTMTMAEYEAN